VWLLNMFTKTSTGADWVAASPEARSGYVAKACRDCSSLGIGDSFPALVVEGMDAFFAIPSLRRYSVSFVFGQIHTAQTLLGDYHPLVDSFRVGEQEAGRL
jgi:hypothetical protein